MKPTLSINSFAKSVLNRSLQGANNMVKEVKSRYPSTSEKNYK